MIKVRSANEQSDIEPVRPGNLGVRFPIRSDYEPVKPSRQAVEVDKGKPAARASTIASNASIAGSHGEQSESPTPQRSTEGNWRLKRGHGVTYAALCLFTIVLYTRPAEFYPSPLTASLALIIALATLAFFIPTQLSLEGTLTARPSEVNLVLLFCLAGLLSVPLAINRLTAWQEFSGTFIRCIVMFIVIVNSVRTKSRLKGLLFIALASGVWLSVEAINDFRLGLATVDGYRAGGRGSGIFGNTNDMALHVVTLFPIPIALLFATRNTLRKLLFAACAAVMLAAIVLSYSRGAFLGLIVVLIFLTMKLGRRHRVGISLAILGLAVAGLLLAPGNYVGRLLSIMPSLDPGESADARRGELFRSLYVALRHPLLGIGMGNYQNEMSYKGLVTHNSYTQVAAEMGAAALVCYTLFIVKPLRKLGQIARETLKPRLSSNYYYLAVGLQASLLGYMVSTFFLSVAYAWYIYYLVGFAVCLRRLYEAETGKAVVVETRKERKQKERKKMENAPLVNEPRMART
ncbi:MAG: O-antigen ligase family protein [Pyrinomonadaceae bacterium]|nr:O-antigen ligase family protein [Pyrinomonadaceae bacterium]